MPPPRGMLRTLSAPVGELIAAVGRGVAEAQAAIDAQSIDNVKALYGSDSHLPKEVVDELRAIGYQPSWYHIPEARVDLSIALSVSGRARGSATGGRIQLHAAPVDATYSNQFDYHLNASSRLHFRVVPVPPPAGAETATRPLIVPKLVDKTVVDAEKLLDSLGIPFEYQDSNQPGPETKITKQEPNAGEELHSGKVLILTAKDTNK